MFRGGGITGLLLALVAGVAVFARAGAGAESTSGASVGLVVVVASTGRAVTAESRRAAAGGTLRGAQVVRLTYFTGEAHVVAVRRVTLTGLDRASAGDDVTFL